MKDKKKDAGQQRPVSTTQRERNPELIEKFYKQIINSFGYAYPAKV
jgi:hypothetical protein